jgi:hypothetical protein
MKKIHDMPYSETNGSRTIQEQDVPQVPQDTEPPPGPVTPEAPEPSAGPHSLDNYQDYEQNPGSNKTDKLLKEESSNSKNKRRKISLADHQNMVKQVELAVTDNNIPPPLIHTAHSMFTMLCDTFHKEFPNYLPQHMQDECVSTIMDKDKK